MNSTPARPELSLSIPCYNEENCLEATARDLLRAFTERGIALELVLVDNGSTDGTGCVIDALAAAGLPVRKVRVDVNQGYGHGVLEGLKACRAPLVGFTCADGQVAADDIARLYQAMHAAGPPLLAKVRRRFRKDGLLRRIQSVGYNTVMLLLFGPMGLDVNGNPKLFPREACDRMRLRSLDWFLDPEVMIKARWMGLRILELDVDGVHRQGGKSHVRWHTCLEFTRNILRYRYGARERELRAALAGTYLGPETTGGERL